MEPFLAFVIVVLCGVVVAMYVSRPDTSPIPAPPEIVANPYDDSEIRSLLGLHEDRFEALTLAVAEGISHVSRAEKRINGTIARARKGLSDNGMESPGLEAEYGELRAIDGGGEPESPVLPMPSQVEAFARDDQAPDDGVTDEMLQYARGFS